jgi:hypothetical protein
MVNSRETYTPTQHQEKWDLVDKEKIRHQKHFLV